MVRGLIPGLCAAVAVAFVATAISRVAPLIGSPVLAIALGIGIRTIVPEAVILRKGLTFASRDVLQAAIVISGLGLSFFTVMRTGLETLPVTLGTIAVALCLTLPLGLLFSVKTECRWLIGVGTAICGASAIAAVASVIEPEREAVALSLGTIFFYNVVAVLLFPSLGHLMHLSQHAFGLWAGTAVNDTSSVVAAGYAYGHEAGTYATIVKLTRAMLILPIVATMALVRRHTRGAHGERIAWRRVMPWFIIWFVAAAVLNTVGTIPSAWHLPLALCATFLISVALAAIGLQTDFRKLLSTGTRALAFGLILWISVAVSSLVLAHLSGS